ncbi:MAG: class III signal peptide-containing protein [Candidatus ainarchaeum sp.]|nr:class III signal peptide-containing protein [Candidatus ainarchaeum sp.]
MVNKKGQGTIEYLIIIAIVIVIALVVVGILIQLMGQGSGIGETSSQIAWKSAQPWAIIDWKVDRDGNLTLILQNNTSEILDLVKVSVGRGEDWNVGISGIISGAKTNDNEVIITGTGISPNTQYAFQKDSIYIDYNTTALSGKRQGGAADITGISQQ